MSLNEVRIQAEDFDLSTEVARLRADYPKVGGVVTFVYNLAFAHSLARKYAGV